MEKTKKKQKVQTHGQGLGRGLAGGMGLNFLFFFVFPWFFAVWPKPRENKKKQKKTKKNKKFRPMGKVWAIHTQTKKTKKQKNQETKKPKKTRLHTPRGGGQMQSVGSCFFFFFFLFFCFFGFLVCVWIAIADVLSRDCQALSVVALEARSIHYSTAMFAMTWCMQPMNSREEWNSILSGCAICCWIFAQEMPQFAHSPGGLFCRNVGRPKGWYWQICVVKNPYDEAQKKYHEKCVPK